MFTEFSEAIHGKKYIQPENVMMANDLAVIHRIISKARLKLFACLKENKPANVHQLAQLLNRDYTNVWRDCQVLANCGIIELKEKRGGGSTDCALWANRFRLSDQKKKLAKKRGNWAGSLGGGVNFFRQQYNVII